jgi:membrane protease YdiL (CAAX protease family)
MELFFRLFILSLFIALTEEILFRGYILNFFQKTLGVTTAIILSSLFFALMHFNFHVLLPYISIFLGGILFAYLTTITKSLYPAIAFHLAWNLSQMLISTFFSKQMNIVFIGQVFEILQIVGLAFLLLYLYKINCKIISTSKK